MPFVQTAWATGGTEFTDYKALVCVMLAGGNDAYNMVVPWDRAQHRQYVRLRTSIALERGTLLRLPMDADGRTFGLHDSLPDLRGLYRAGELAFLYDVGTLVEPIADKIAFTRRAVAKPLGLYSHSDQQEQWQTALLTSRSDPSGWLGRVADGMGDGGLGAVPVNLTLSGVNRLQTGRRTRPVSVSSNDKRGLKPISRYGGRVGGIAMKSLIDDLFAVEQQHLLKGEYRDRLRHAIAVQEQLSSALTDAPEATAQFNGDQLSTALKQVARLISVRQQLDAQRQTFFVRLGGWDTHDDLLDRQSILLSYVNVGLASFREELVALGVFDQVTTFTMSEFGRTLSSNGRGSDHGWSGHQLVMGGAVQGRRSFGTYPELASNSPMDVGRGVYIPSLATDVYFADLALWLGVPQSELPSILPTLPNFYATDSAAPPLGLFVQYG